MTNKIYDLTDSFDFNILKLGNPNLINNNNYFSKITHGIGDKNFYLQLPKCITKQGIIKGSNKSQCELCYSINQKNVIEFLENLEKHCIQEIYSNKELWFYNAKNITIDDIEELMTPLIKTYKHGKNFLVKNLLKPDKLNLYDENENMIALDDYNINHEFLPLINIGGVKFSNKNLSIEINLTQMLVLYPSDDFEKQILIKVKKENNNSNTLEKQSNFSEKETLEQETLEKEILEKEALEKETLEQETLEKEALEKEALEKETLEKEALEKETLEKEILEKEILEKEALEKEALEKETLKKQALEQETLEQEILKKENCDINNIELNTFDINEEIPFEIKSREEIYLEVYKNAKKKAKEIRKNAIQAFLEAKNIKTKYNLESLVDSDSSDEEEYL